MPHLTLELLGTFLAKLDDQPVTGFESDKVRALLIYLAVEQERPHRRETVAGLLWPDISEQHARTNLRNVLANLRKALGDRTTDKPFILVSRQTLQFNPASDADIDVLAFLQATTSTLTHAHQATSSCEDCIQALEGTNQLYKGEFLPGFSLNSELFETWISTWREKLHIACLDALHHLAEYAEVNHDSDKVVQYAQRQLVLEPWRESAHRRLMRTYAQHGQRAMALQQYETCERILQVELGILPEPEMLALYRQISMGEINEEQESGRPIDEAQAASQAIALPNNLSGHVWPFIGRRDILEQVQHHLLDADCRLLTLLGPGGAGKTRLAREAGRILVEGQNHGRFADGAYFVPLAAIEAVAGIVPAIAQAIKFNFTNGGDPDKQLTAYLSRKHILLILDNFEQLTAGTGILVDLLRSAPHLNLLVTTRVKLSISTEHVIVIPGMAYPETANASMDIEAYGALQLFQQFAQRLGPAFRIDKHNFPDAIKICQLVHGMPLGLLLASSWMAMLTPGEIADEIERSLDFLETDWLDIPARQRGMRAVFEHTWQLLPPKERQMLASLSVFTGGWTREAALEIAQVTLRDMLSLINKCLVQRTPNGRYGMHELLRQFAQEKLELDDDDRIKVYTTHATYYADRLTKWEQALKGMDHAAALSQITADFENAHVAVDWKLDTQDLAGMEFAIDCLCRTYSLMRRYRDGTRFCRTIAAKLAVIPGDTANTLRANILALGSRLIEYTGDIDEAISLSDDSLAALGLTYESALKIPYKSIPASRSGLRVLAYALFAAGLCRFQKDLMATRQAYTISHDIYSELGDGWHQASLLLALAAIYRFTDERTKTIELEQQALQIYENLQDPCEIVATMQSLGHDWIFLGYPEQGEVYYERANTLAERTGVRSSKIEQRALLIGNILKGDFREAVASLSLEEARMEDRGILVRLLEIRHHLMNAHRHLGHYDAVKRIAKASEAQCFTAGYTLYSAGSQLTLSEISLALGHYEQAYQHYRRNRQIRKENGLSLEHEAVYLYILYGLGDIESPIGVALDILRCVIKSENMWGLLVSLPAIALTLVSTNRIERAVEVYALACTRPFVAKSQWFEDVAGQYIRVASASLHGDMVTAAEARGRKLDFWETAKVLVEELGEAV